MTHIKKETHQLGLLDVEYSGKDLPLFGVKGLE